MKYSLSRSPRRNYDIESCDQHPHTNISRMAKDAWSTGFEVARAGSRAEYFENEQKMLTYRQDYEINALNEILGERMDSLYRLQDTHDREHDKYIKDQTLQIQRIQEEEERKLDVIRQNQEDGKESLFQLIYETEQAMEERYNIICETEQQFKIQTKQMKSKSDELKFVLEDINTTNKNNDDKILNIIHVNNQHEQKLGETVGNKNKVIKA